MPTGKAAARRARVTSSSSKPSSPRSLMLVDLARSGLDERAAKRLGYEPLTAAQVSTLTRGRHAVPAYKIPYYDAEGQATGFYRLRFLEPTHAPDEPDKVIRYWQPSGTEPRAYLSPGLAWEALLSDVHEPLCLTEGEKKAATACAHGIPTIGLGGVWSWRSSRFGHALLPDLETIAWTNREITVAFDSDLITNPKVQGALSSLGRTLLARGAIVKMLPLPPGPDGAKRGLDDVLVAGGRDALTALEPEPLRDTAALWQLNDEVALIRDIAGVVELTSGSVYTATAFTGTVYANRRFTRVTQDGKLKEMAAATEWLRWPHRREHPRLTYAPGGERVLPDGSLNLWRGWGAEPKRGDVSLFYQLLDHVFTGAPAWMAKWLIQWYAYPIRYPGTKLYTTVLLHGAAHGTGKSLLGYLVGSCYGANFTAINQEQLQSGFNNWAYCRQFILGEELTSTDRRDKQTEYNHLKFMVTRERMEINRKYQPQFELPDCLNYQLTANEVDAIYLENKDRRLFVHEVTAEAASDEFYHRLDGWLRSGEAAAALLYHLKHEVDLTGFNPRAPAPMTEAKRALQELSETDLDLFARRLVEDPDTLLAPLGPRAPCALWTLSELLELADPGAGRRLSQVGLAKALRRAGLRGLDATRTRLGVLRLWAVRDPARWARASHDERAREVERFLGRPTKGARS